MSRRSLRPALVLAGGLAAVALFALLTVLVSATPDQANPSSRSAGRLGTLALYTWMQQLGFPVSRVSGSFDLGGADVLVEYDPLIAFAPAEVDQVTRHVRGGGDLILALAPESVAAATPLLQSFDVQVSGEVGAGTATPAQPFDIADRVRSVPTSGGFAFAASPGVTPLLVQGGDVVAVATRVGAGRVYVVGNTAPLSNDGLRHDDSAYLVLTILERSRGGHVAFDEFHHGEGGAVSGAGAIFSGSIGFAAALAAVVVLLALGLNGRRLGRPASAAAPAVPTASAYVRAMGALLSRSRDRGALADRYADDLKRRVAELTGVSPGLDDAAFTAALGAAGHELTGEVEALLRRARALAGGRPGEPALLDLARAVDAAERRWSTASPVPAQWRG